MKELVFMSGPNCPMSVEMEDKVLLFEALNPDIKVNRIVAGQDDLEFRKKSDGYKLSATPTFIALEDEKVLEIHEGRACEVRLLKMFDPESDSEAEGQDAEPRVENKRIIVFIGSSWCSEEATVPIAKNKTFCDEMPTILDEFSKANPGIEVLTIDVELESDLVPDNCYDQDINALPTVFWINNGKFVKSHEGTFSLQDLINFIN
jgi:thiol-disulfide isomerase/thioredoxin